MSRKSPSVNNRSNEEHLNIPNDVDLVYNHSAGNEDLLLRDNADLELLQHYDELDAQQ